MKANDQFKFYSVGFITVWLSIFALFAFLLVLFASFSQTDNSQLIRFDFTLNNYRTLFGGLYAVVFLKSFYIATLCTLFCLLLGFPFAYILACKVQRFKELFLLLLIIPFWTSSLIRSYAIVIILKTKGLLNGVLLYFGLIHQPLQLLFTNTAVMIGLVYNLLPFMILPLYANLEKFDQRLIEAARSLGASKVRIFGKIILPLSMPGIISGAILVFLPAMTLFYIPDLLGGAKSLLLGNLIENQFLFSHNWPLGSATSVTLTVVMSILILLHWLFDRNKKQGVAS